MQTIVQTSYGLPRWPESASGVMAEVLANMPPRVLIADDQPDVLAALHLLLKNEGFQIETVTSPAAVLDALSSGAFDVVLIDLNYARDTTSGREGLDLLSEIRALNRTLPVVVMTAWGSIELAVEAMQGGSGDFIQKPWDNAHLLSVLRKQLLAGNALRQQQQAAEARERELNDAREIQRGLVPRTIPQLQGCELAAVWQSAREVGGDYFDVLKFDEHSAALCIADVMGKGLPAALLMSNVQAAVRTLAAPELSTAALCAQLNRLVCQNVDAGRFVTFFYCLLDTARKRLIYTNAGHNAPWLVRRDGSALSLHEGGLVLGLLPESEYHYGEIELQPGDRLVMFTDGVTEAHNTNDEEYGEQQLLQLLRENRTLGAQLLQHEISQAVQQFSQGELADDTTLIVVAMA